MTVRFPSEVGSLCPSVATISLPDAVTSLKQCLQPLGFASLAATDITISLKESLSNENIKSPSFMSATNLTEELFVEKS